LRNTLELIRGRLTGLSSTAKLLAGSLMVIVAMGLFLVAQWSATVTTVPFSVTATAYEQAKTYLGNRGVAYVEENGRLMVPAERHAELLAGFAEQGGGSEAGID
jgi:flagellar biosynthesis/type III secretory pathway M-ring protein FliF/YscJ